MSTLSALLSSYSDVFASELADVHENHEALLHRIVLLATFEKMQTASLNTPTSPFGPAAQNSVDFCDLEGLERPLLLQQISDSAARLDASLTRAWERAEESLWTTVLKGIINSAACNGSTDGCSAAAAAAAASVSSETTTAAPTSTPSSADLAAASNLWDNVNYRHHAVVCQALAASLTGLAVAVTRWLTVQWQQMIECGVPLYFEGLLSCYGQEAEMLENWAWAIQFLVYWSVIVRPDGRTVDNTADNEKAAVEPDTTSAMPVSASPLVRITGYKQCVLTIPQSAWKQVPPEHQTRGSVVLYLRPYAFNVGINEQQTIAERLEKTGLQTAINAQGLNSLQNYFDKYTRKFGAPERTPANEDVCDLIVSIKHILASNRSKPVDIFELAARISLSLNAIRLTSCKSAKDRTGMAISLEQARWLRNVEWMKPDTFSSALKCIRNTEPRVGSYFCFRSLNEQSADGSPS
ncbi:Type I inositol 3,4-bisphosphate 4-phosphatase [Sparganum proliferum]